MFLSPISIRRPRCRGCPLAVSGQSLAFSIEQTRAVLIFGSLPDWRSLAIYTAIAAIIMWLGFVWFQKTRRGFADVL